MSYYVGTPKDDGIRWATYTELWREQHITRGALDRLVQQGRVRWTTGLDRARADAETALEATARLTGAQGWVNLNDVATEGGYQLGDTFYDAGELARIEAAFRLTGDKTGLGGVAFEDLVMPLVRCPRCDRDVPAKLLMRGEGCAACFVPGEGP